MTEKFDNEAERTKIIKKMAKTDYPISELIARRWSARAFSTPYNISDLFVWELGGREGMVVIDTTNTNTTPIYKQIYLKC